MIIDYEDIFIKLFNKCPLLNSKEEKMFDKLSEWWGYDVQQLSDKELQMRKEKINEKHNTKDSQ